MMQTKQGGCWVVICFILLAGARSGAATNDLVITSITKEDECVTLQWRSHPGEYYTVHWTDRLELPIFWRVAEVNVPSGGTNTTWTEGNCSESMMGSGGTSALSAEQKTAFIEKHKEFTAPDYLYPPGHANAPKSTNTTASGGGGQMALLSSPATPNRFYRVARTAVVGFVDGWGSALGSIPTNLGHVATYKTITVSASPRGDSGAHSLALLTNGTVVAWGVTNYGQCNVPTNLGDVVSIAAGGRHSMALTRDGEIVMWGNTVLGQITNRPAAATNIAAIAAGLWHSMALRADGTVFAWGDLFNGTNAVPAGLSNITAIAAGPRHCLALRDNGTVAAWGFDYSFLKNFLPTNVPTDLSNVVAISAGMEHNQALIKNGTIRVWGRASNPAVTNVPVGLTNLLAISAGWHYGLALSNNAAIARWGQNSGAEGIDSVVALSGGATHSLVVRTNSLSPVIRKQPLDMEAPLGVNTNIFVEASSSLPLRYQWQRSSTNLPSATNAVLAFTNLQDANDGFYQVRVATDAGTNLSRVARVSAVHPPVITNQTPELNIYRPQYSFLESLHVGVYSKGTDRVTYQWFRNGGPDSFFYRSDFRPISFGSTNDEGAFYVTVRNIAGSTTSSVWNVKIRLQGESIGWGDNSYGQLNSSRAETNLVAVSAGLHNLGLRENGTVYAWGDSAYGQTNVPAGLTNIIAVAAGTSHSLALREDGRVIAWGWNAYGQTNVPASATNIVAVAGGDRHSLALRNTGRVLAWGDNSYGATNLPTDLTNASAIAAGYGYSLALLSNGTVRAWGTWVTTPSGLSNVTAIAAGYTHALALKTNGTVTAFGGDFGSGELSVPSGLSNVLQIAAGDRWNLVLKNDGTLITWGDNTFNQTNLPANLGDVKQITAGIGHGLALAYSRMLNYPVNVPQDLLLICNTNDADSVAVMNYYRTNRPLIAAANILGIGGATNSVERYTNLLETTNSLLAPFQQWLANNPTKRPNYIVMVYGVPASIVPAAGLCELCGEASTSYLLTFIYPNRRPFVTHLNMRTPQDCFAYVDKLRYFGTNYSPGKIYISPRAGGYGNANYYFDDVRVQNYAGYFAGSYARAGVLSAGVNPTNVFYTEGTNDFNAHFLSCTNVAGYLSWGWHGLLGLNWSVSGVIDFYGSSSWYPIQTIESFNGQWEPYDYQNSFHNWFSSETFAGTNYAYTAVCGVSHIYEPSFGGVNDPYIYFGLWERGRCFAISAWLSCQMERFQAVGDPFVKK